MKNNTSKEQHHDDKATNRINRVFDLCFFLYIYFVCLVYKWMIFSFSPVSRVCVCVCVYAVFRCRHIMIVRFFCFHFPSSLSVYILQYAMCKHIRPLHPRRQNTQEVWCCCFVNTLKIYLNEQLEKLGWFSLQKASHSLSLSKFMAHKLCTSGLSHLTL